MDIDQFNLNNWNEAEIILALSMQKIYDAFCQNRGLQYLVDQTRNLLKRPLIIYDTSNKILAASHDAECVFFIYQIKMLKAITSTRTRYPGSIQTV